MVYIDSIPLGMRYFSPLLLCFFFFIIGSHDTQAQKRPPFLTGNYKSKFVLDHKYFKNEKSFLKMIVVLDEVDDVTHYRHVVDKFYRDTAGAIFDLCYAVRPMGEKHDTTILYEYYKELQEFPNLISYRKLNDELFSYRDTLYFWWSNADGEYAFQIEGADPKTFVPFKHARIGGKDSHHAFFRKSPSEFEMIKGADPWTIFPMEVKPGYPISGKCYFKDKQNVFFGAKKIEGADPISFQILDRPDYDAGDKNHHYLNGEVVR